MCTPEKPPISVKIFFLSQRHREGEGSTHPTDLRKCGCPSYNYGDVLCCLHAVVSATSDNVRHPFGISAFWNLTAIVKRWRLYQLTSSKTRNSDKDNPPIPSIKHSSAFTNKTLLQYNWMWVTKLSFGFLNALLQSLGEFLVSISRKVVDGL